MSISDSLAGWPHLGSGRAPLARALNDVRPLVRDVLGARLMAATRESLELLDRDLDASIALRRNSRQLLVDYGDFAEHYFKRVATAVDGAVNDILSGANARRQDAAPGISLSLIDFGQMEEHMLVDRMGARIRNACDDAFDSLSQRLAELFGLLKLSDRDNPFHPLVFCTALGDAIGAMGFTPADRLLLLRQFDVPLTAPLRELYEMINRRLDERGVKEKNPAAAFRNTVAGVRTPLPVSRAGKAQPSAESLLEALYQRMQLLPPVATVVPVAPADGVTPVAGATVAAGPLIALAPAAAAGTGLSISMAPVDPALLQSISEIQRYTAMAAMASARGAAAPMGSAEEARLRLQLAERATRQVDKLTIELMGLLFDRIHADKHLPGEIKTVLARLQFPMMKIALTDSDLFVSPVQPARLLLDRIASTAVGWSPAGEDNRRYLAEVTKAVNTVALAVNEGPEVFARALTEFEQYLNDERVRDDDPVLRAKRALEEAETREVMAINAAIEVRRAFDGVQLESYLRDFLLGPWIKVLVAATLRERTEAGVAAPYRTVVADLVWSVQPKVNIDDRKRLVKVIPGVLGLLRNGLQLIEFPTADTQAFFSQLMASHAQAVKALETAYARTPPVDAEALRARIDDVRIVEPDPPRPGEDLLTVSPELVRQAVARNHAEVNLLGPATAGPDSSIAPSDLSDSQLDELIGKLQRGTWYELLTGNQVERVRLRWISPRRTFYLFTGAESGAAHTLPPHLLRDYIRARRLRPLGTDSLFERAVDDLMHDLRPADQPAPGP